MVGDFAEEGLQAAVPNGRDSDHTAPTDGQGTDSADGKDKDGDPSETAEDPSGDQKARRPSQISKATGSERSGRSGEEKKAQATHVREVQRSHMRSIRQRQSVAPGAQDGEEEEQEKPKEGTFVDAAAMKERVRQKLSKHKYDVSDFYKADGVWQAVARDGNFEKITLSVITFNALWIAIDTDMNDAPVLIQAHPVFQIAENLFCAFFSFEWFVRSMSFRRLRDGFKDAWFVFDMTMVTLMVAETWLFSIFLLFVSSGGGGSSFGILRVARLMRLSRMCRMARLIRAMPELFVMLKGLFAATRSVFFTLVLLFGLLFVFAIAFKQLTTSIPALQDLFPSIPGSMYTLLVHGTLLLSADVKAQMIRENGGPVLTFLFFFFILLAAVLLMNMLIGVLCEVVSAVAVTEKEEMLVTFVHEKLTAVMALIDEDGGGTISRNEFMQILDNEGAIESLQDVGVDVIGLVDYADFIFGGDEEETEDGDEIELTLPQFMEVILQLRGSNSATVKDVVDIRKFVRNMIQQTTKRLDVIEEKHDSVQSKMHENLGLLSEMKGWLDAEEERFWPGGKLQTLFNDERCERPAATVTNGDVDIDPVVQPLFVQNSLTAGGHAPGMYSGSGTGISLPLAPSTPAVHKQMHGSSKPGYSGNGDSDLDTKFRRNEIPTTTTAPLPGRLVDVVPRTQVTAFGPKHTADPPANGGGQAFFGITASAAAAGLTDPGEAGGARPPTVFQDGQNGPSWKHHPEAPGWKASCRH